MRPADLDDISPAEMAVYMADMSADRQREARQQTDIRRLVEEKRLHIVHDPWRR